MTQPNDDYQLSDSPPRNEYQLSDTDRINYLESSVASFNHMVVLLNERLDSLEAARLAAEMPPNVESDLHRRIQNVDSSHNLLSVRSRRCVSIKKITTIRSPLKYMISTSKYRN